MPKAEKAIDYTDFSRIPRIRDFIARLPNEVQVCAHHGELVGIEESDFLPNPSGAAPFGKAAFVGCCDAAIETVLAAI